MGIRKDWKWWLFVLAIIVTALAILGEFVGEEKGGQFVFTEDERICGDTLERPPIELKTDEERVCVAGFLRTEIRLEMPGVEINEEAREELCLYKNETRIRNQKKLKELCGD